MYRILSIIFTGIVTSLFFFPITFKAFPVYNTKNLLAAVGLVLLGLHLAQKRKCSISKDFLILSSIATIFSIIVLFSVSYNETRDYSYTRYIISMWIWWSSAYVVYRSIKSIHSDVSIILMCNYLIGVCVVQCISALVIDSYPAIKSFIDTHIEQGQTFLTRVNRIYGIGANLDVAGSRFAAVLVMTAIMINQTIETKLSKYLPYYIVAFLIIAVVGNMIARTTMVGIGIALVYLLFQPRFYTLLSSEKNKRILLWIIGLLLFTIVLCIYLYNTNPNIRDLLRFAFEGFFNFFEKGNWSTGSTDILRRMYVFPDNLKTWLIGDGYFNNPRYDPYYTGEITGGFYKNSDAGYIRFIFYTGLIGVITFSFFICKAGHTCMRRFIRHKTLFILLIAVNFIVWIKVSTDIFLVFALFLCIGEEENKKYEQRIALQP